MFLKKILSHVKINNTYRKINPLLYFRWNHFPYYKSSTLKFTLAKGLFRRLFLYLQQCLKPTGESSIPFCAGGGSNEKRWIENTKDLRGLISWDSVAYLYIYRTRPITDALCARAVCCPYSYALTYWYSCFWKHS